MEYRARGVVTRNVFTSERRLQGTLRAVQASMMGISVEHKDHTQPVLSLSMKIQHRLTKFAFHRCNPERAYVYVCQLNTMRSGVLSHHTSRSAPLAARVRNPKQRTVLQPVLCKAGTSTFDFSKFANRTFLEQASRRFTAGAMAGTLARPAPPTPAITCAVTPVARCSRLGEGHRRR